MVVFTRYANWLTANEFSFILNLIATKNNIDTKNENAMKRFEKQHFPYGKRFNSISNINSKGYFAVTIYHTPYIIVMHHKEKSENAYILSLQGSDLLNEEISNCLHVAKKNNDAMMFFNTELNGLAFVNDYYLLVGGKYFKNLFLFQLPKNFYD